MMLVTIHVGILLITAWNIFKADHLGFKWIRGSILKLKEEEVMKYHERVFFGCFSIKTFDSVECLHT